MKLTPGQWSGPVESTYGLHLVLVQERTNGAKAEWDKVRPLVEREVQSERRAASVQALYDQLLAKYVVTIERPLPGPSAALPAASALVRETP
jgi:parvulin-like peptidyl-prolyl isomerase